MCRNLVCNGFNFSTVTATRVQEFTDENSFDLLALRDPSAFEYWRGNKLYLSFRHNPLNASSFWTDKKLTQEKTFKKQFLLTQCTIFALEARRDIESEKRERLIAKSFNFDKMKAIAISFWFRGASAFWLLFKRKLF